MNWVVKTLVTIRTVKHAVTINQGGFNLCNTIIFQEVNTVSSEGKCRKSQSIKDPFHKLWIILEKTAKIRTCHYTYMAGMGETCNHVAAVMYRVEAAVRISLPNPACTSNPNDWLPNRKRQDI